MQVLYIDGGCSNNDQKDISKRKMVSVVMSEGETLLSEQFKNGGSNNIAELIAVKNALQWAKRYGVKEVEIRTDSRNNFAWFFGKKVGKKINDRVQVLALKAVLEGLKKSVRGKMVLVPREENKAGWYIEEKYNL